LEDDLIRRHRSFDAHSKRGEFRCRANIIKNSLAGIVAQRMSQQ